MILQQCVARAFIVIVLSTAGSLLALVRAYCGCVLD